MTPPGPSARSASRLHAVRAVSKAISAAHMLVYLGPESAEEAAALGVEHGPGGPAYFAFRAAALGAVPWQVTSATFYNFPPRQVQRVTEAWDVASPDQWQASRFRVIARALKRVNASLTTDQLAEARSLIDPVVAAADVAGKALAAANASVKLPTDPLLALWQQLTVLREWRGDAHVVVLAANELGPCACNVMHTATGRLPTAIARATRHWNDEEWAAATADLAARGWLDADGNATETGVDARERIEDETDELCVALWAPIDSDSVSRLADLVRDGFA